MVNAKSTVGLLFTGGDGPLPQQILNIAEEARSLSTGESSPCGPGGDSRTEPLLVAADSGLLLAEKAGFCPHWIIGDMDSLETERLSAYPPEKVIKFPRAKDYTDTELAFFLLREKKCRKIWIVGGGGGRIDHLFAIRSLFEREQPPERWFTASEDIRCLQPPPLSAADLSISSDMELPWELLFSPDTNTPLFPVSVFPLGNGPWEAESSGLRWPLADLPWDRGFFGLCNEAPEGCFSVKAKQGRFLVILPLTKQKAPSCLY